MGIFDFFKGGSKDKNDHITKTYHENGKLELEGNFKGGKKEGLFKVYHENGKLKLEGNYKDDKQEGFSESTCGGGSTSSGSLDDFELVTENVECSAS